MISVFSTYIIENPHYFDLETEALNIIIKFLTKLNSKNFSKNKTSKINILNNYIRKFFLLYYITKTNIDYGILIGGENPNDSLDDFLDKFTNYEILYKGDYDFEGLLFCR